MASRILAAFVLVFALAASAGARADDNGLTWESWNPELFTRAQAEQRLVILDLEAVWCHWCHVMEKTTYRDEKVVALLKSKYLAVRVDQDANPDLSNRYGDWGWPATIIFASDGTELAKWRGYLPPERMVGLLEAFIADPTPGPSARFSPADITPAESPLLDPVQRADLVRRSEEFYDRANGGWGEFNKFIDTESMDLLLVAAEKGDAEAARRARQTFDAALNLIDQEWGGIYQYSDEVDWKSPHYEKIMWYQAAGLRQYAQAYALWQEPNYLAAAEDLKRFLLTKLSGPEGAFYTSQDADIDETLPGKSFYALTAEERAKLGREPRIDTNIYARENGWAISGLAAFYNATGDQSALDAAERAAEYILTNRAIDEGGFRHGANDRAGPYLGDTLAMGQAALDLYAATGDRRWLDVADRAGAFIIANFKDETGGFRTTVKREAATGAFLKDVKQIDEQIAATRFANSLHRYLGRESYRVLSEHGARYLAAAVEELPRPLPGILLGDRELSEEPTHITIVGHKDSAEAAILHAAGRAYPALYKRIDWWDKREGPLPNPDVQYPELDQAAAFACTNKICSQPVFDPADLGGTVSRMLAATNANGESMAQ
jgi:uncharacterized protein YyaL (SSP411 family)